MGKQEYFYWTKAILCSISLSLLNLIIIFAHDLMVGFIFNK